MHGNRQSKYRSKYFEVEFFRIEIKEDTIKLTW